MVKTSKRKKGKNLTARFGMSKNTLLLVTILLFGLVGYYLLSGANANPHQPSPNATVYQDAISKSRAAGEVFDVPLTWRGGNVTSPPEQILFTISYNAELVSARDYTCGAGLKCRLSAWTGGRNAYMYSAWHTLCIDPYVGAHPQFEILATVTFMALQSFPGRGDGYSTAITRAPGSCDSNPTGAGAVHRGQTNPCYYPHSTNADGTTNQNPGENPANCEHGKDPWAGQFGAKPVSTPSNRTTSSGTGNTGTGTGTGGGGGSIATTQSDNPAPLPSSSDQGDKEQPKLEPSPFFDGKLFAAGSDASVSPNAVTIGGFKLGYGWFYLGVAFVLLSVAGFFGWKYRQNLQPVLASTLRALHIKQ